MTKDREDLVLPVSKTTLEKAPSFEWDEWPDMQDETWRKNIQGYYDTAR